MARPDTGESREKTSSWKGKSSSTLPKSNYGWQVGRDSAQIRLTRRRNRLRRLSFQSLLFLVGLGSAVFLATLLHREMQPPFVAIVKTAYPNEFPPNSWSYEDIESLRTGADSLDRKTLNVVDLSDSEQTNEKPLAPPEEHERKRVVAQAERAGVIMFYVSMHGVVNDFDEACVVATKSASLEAKTWVRVSSLLSQIEEWNIPKNVKKLLILDCNRQNTNWKIGLFRNNFAERLSQALEKNPVPNLAILNSTSSDQIGHASAGFQGSVFGQFLRLGLAGAADLPLEGGDHDHRVTLEELHRYLVRHVDSWSKENRGVSQQPMLIMTPNSAADFAAKFSLTCSLDRSRLDRLLNKFDSSTAADATVSSEKIESLWTTYSDLCKGYADSIAPVEMGELRRRLVWLEQASQAGAAYRLGANKAAEQSRSLSAGISARIKTPESLERKTISTSEYSDIWFPGLASRLHSLHLFARLGQSKPAVIEDIFAKLTQLETEGSSDSINAMLGDSPDKSFVNSLGIVHFLKLIQRTESLRGTPTLTPGSFVPALRLQMLADSASVPSDPRGQVWIQDVIKDADLARRRSEDGIFTVGTADPSFVETAKSGYQKATSIAKEVQNAWRLSDLVNAELPHLAHWLERYNAIRDVSEEPRLKIENELLDLIAANYQLMKSLDSPLETETAGSAEDLFFSSQYKAVLTQYQSLQETFNKACQELTDSSEFTPDQIQMAAEVLSSPLLSTRSLEGEITPLKQRQKIKSTFLKTSDDLHHRSLVNSVLIDAPNVVAKPHSEKDKSTRTASTASEHLPTVNFPILAILEKMAQIPSSESQAAKSLEKKDNSTTAGTLARAILSSIPSEIEKARERHLASSDQPRRELSIAAQLTRSWAPFRHSAPPTDSVVDLRRADAQQILLSQSQRYLDDFWGPSNSGEQAFFDSAANDSLEAARRISQNYPGTSNPASQNQIKEIKSLLELRRKAAQAGLAVHADALLLFELVDHPAARVSITKSVPGMGDGLPSGTGMLRIEDQNGVLLGSTVEFQTGVTDAAVVSKPNVLQVALENAHGQLTDTIGSATAIFRGHEFRDDLVIKTAAGTNIESQPLRMRSARVRLNGNKRQKASVIFVLDCSASMQKGMPFESPASIVSRMEIAKAALLQMLSGLATRGDARVGVVLYGHRVGWSTKEPNQLMTQPVLASTLPEGLKPYEDVETILPLGRFDSITLTRVAQQLEKVKPWGETPLYLSLTQALLEFKEGEEDVQRSVVVITDGVNYQFNPRLEMAKTAQDVLNAEGSRRIPLHIVGFGIQANEAQEAQREFSQLARATGGQYVSVSEASFLEATLEGILQRQHYSTIAPSGSASKASLGISTELNWESDDPQSYTVTFDSVSQKLDLTGGEAVELFLSQDGQSMLSAGYDVGSPIFSPLVSGSRQEPSGIRLGVHFPAYEGTTVKFDFSLQHEQQQFVSRPREVWIEITPVFNNSQPNSIQKYVFYDPEFVPNKPVPLIRATALGWPKDASRARIEFWCKWTSTESSHKIAFSDLPDPGVPKSPSLSLDGIPELKYQVRRRQGEPTRVDFIETYSSNVSGGTMLKVDIVGPIPPSRTFHQFDEANRFSAHSFLFDHISESLFHSSNSIRIVSRRRTLDSALHLDTPLLIDVRAQPSTIITTP